jgi:transposase
MASPAPTRAIPYGPYGYTDIQRRNATVNQPAIPTLRSVADRCVPSERSLRRWQQRIRERGNPDRLGAKGKRGKFKLSRRGAFIIWYFKHIKPAALFIEVRRFLQTCTGEPLNATQLSRELKRLGFTRKKLQRQSKNRCEASRVHWWTHGPDAPQIELRGVAGLDSRLLVDIDEKGIWLHEANRNYGHAIEGERAVDEAPIEQHEGIKATLLLVRARLISLHTRGSSMQHSPLRHVAVPHRALCVLCVRLSTATLVSSRPGFFQGM